MENKMMLKFIKKKIYIILKFKYVNLQLTRYCNQANGIECNIKIMSSYFGIVCMIGKLLVAIEIE